MLSRLFTTDSFVLMSRRRWATSPLNSRRLGYLCIALMMLAGVLMRRLNTPPHFQDYLPDWLRFLSATSHPIMWALSEPRFLLSLVAGLWLLHEMLRKHYTGELDELMLTRLSASDFIWCTSGELIRWFALRLAIATIVIQWTDIFLMAVARGHTFSLAAAEVAVTTLRTLEILSLIAFSCIFIWWSLLRYSDPLFMLRDLLVIGGAATGIALLVFVVWDKVSVMYLSPELLYCHKWINAGNFWVKLHAIRGIVPPAALTLLWSTLAWVSYRWLEPRFFAYYRD
jgi:hypothetical protein